MVNSADYQKYVLDDLTCNSELAYAIEASILERLIKRTEKTDKIHPNPDDEFCNPDIGPNGQIVSKYVLDYSNPNTAEAMEAVMVEKISTGGYRLLNGHHRWLAAHRVQRKNMKIHIVNVTGDEKIITMLRNSDKKICVSFDLDEVLLTENGGADADKKLVFPVNHIYRHTLKKNVGLLVRELQEMGCDVWVYTKEYWSEERIQLLFKIHNAKVNGIVNGLTKKRSNKAMKEAFREKYETILHIDEMSLTMVNTITKDYAIYDLTEHGAAWAAGAMKVVKGLKINETKNEDESVL